LIGPVPSARRAQLEALLLEDVSPPLLSLGLLQAHGTARFLACVQDAQIVGLVYLGEDGTAMPISVKSRAAAMEIGEALREHAPRRVIGAKLAVSGVLAGMDRSTERAQALRLHEFTADDMGPFVTPELRPATPDDLSGVLASARLAYESGEGRQPDDREQARLRSQIERQRVFIVEAEGEVAFRVEIETESRFGAHLGDIFTHPEHRARGLASLGLGQLARSTLARLPRLSAFAPADNQAAQKVVRKVGFGPGVTWTRAELR